MQRDQVSALVNAFDIDNDGQMDLQEFVDAMQEMFGMFDRSETMFGDQLDLGMNLRRLSVDAGVVNGLHGIVHESSAADISKALLSVAPVEATLPAAAVPKTPEDEWMAPVPPVPYAAKLSPKAPLADDDSSSRPATRPQSLYRLPSHIDLAAPDDHTSRPTTEEGDQKEGAQDAEVSPTNGASLWNKANRADRRSQILAASANVRAAAQSTIQRSARQSIRNMSEHWQGNDTPPNYSPTNSMPVSPEDGSRGMRGNSTDCAVPRQGTACRTFPYASAATDHGAMREGSRQGTAYTYRSSRAGTASSRTMAHHMEDLVEAALEQCEPLSPRASKRKSYMEARKGYSMMMEAKSRTASNASEELVIDPEQAMEIGGAGSMPLVAHIGGSDWASLDAVDVDDDFVERMWHRESDDAEGETQIQMIDNGRVDITLVEGSIVVHESEMAAEMAAAIIALTPEERVEALESMSAEDRAITLVEMSAAEREIALAAMSDEIKNETIALMPQKEEDELTPPLTPIPEFVGMRASQYGFC